VALLDSTRQKGRHYSPLLGCINARGDSGHAREPDSDRDGYRATFSQEPLTVRKTIDEGTAEDVASASEPATQALATILEQVRQEFSGPGRRR
jgi:hypothetical protein